MGDEKREFQRFAVQSADNVEVWLRPDQKGWPLIFSDIIDISEGGVGISTRHSEASELPEPLQEVPIEVLIAETRLYFVGKVAYHNTQKARLGIEFAPLSRRNVEFFYEFLKKKSEAAF